MCNICRQNPCANLCPENAFEEKLYCPVCGSVLGEVAYIDKDGDILGCDSCVTVRNMYNN